MCYTHEQLDRSDSTGVWWVCDMGGGRVGGLISVWDVCCVEVEMVRES